MSQPVNVTEQTYTVQYAAKLLSVGSNTLFADLRKLNMLDTYNLPYQKFIDLGYFSVRRREYEQPNGLVKQYGRTLVTDKGIRFLRDHYYQSSQSSNTSHICGDLDKVQKQLLSIATELVTVNRTNTARNLSEMAGNLGRIKAHLHNIE